MLLCKFYKYFLENKNIVKITRQCVLIKKLMHYLYSTIVSQKFII